MKSSLLSAYASFSFGPPTIAPVRMLGLGFEVFKNWSPSAQLKCGCEGIDDPLWWILMGKLVPYPTIYDILAGFSPSI